MDENTPIANETDNETLGEALRIRREKLAQLQGNGLDPFEITCYKVTANSREIVGNFKQMEGQTVDLAGRITNRRGMGNAAFVDIHDEAGRMQVYLKIDSVGQEAFEKADKWDLGDIIGVQGLVFRTKRGEISVHAKKLTLLAKALRPLPDKHKGLKDTDTRYRQRYLDLISNPGVRETFKKRSAIIKSIRETLDTMGFIEVETPILNVIPGGAAARPFLTHHNALNMPLYLRIAPELFLKRLIVGGMERVYEIGRVFRNEGMSVKHNPEFTSIELYQAYADYFDMMDLTETLIRRASQAVGNEPKVQYQGEEIDLESPFRRVSMVDAVKEVTGEDFGEFYGDDKRAQTAGKKLGLELSCEPTWGNILVAIFEKKVEDTLLQPTFIYDYPVENSPLTKRKKSSTLLTERFEFFVARRELANAYSELNDPIDQMERFRDQVRLRDAGDEEANMLDEDFVTALEHGMAPTGGLGIGVDRLVMLLTDSASIRDVILFPTMKPR